MVSFGFPTETIAEGSVKVVVPRLSASVKKAHVFYNPIMKLNRDIAVAALQTYQKMLSRKLIVCEPLAGCGVRGIRFATEVKGIRQVVINDLNPEAVKLAKFNVRKNGLVDEVHVENTDANTLLSLHSAPAQRFDYVDLDPFGSPAPFIDSAIRALRSGGLLGLTATDVAPLCGVHPQSCLRKYGGRPLRTEYCHELAIRILIGSLVLTAARHDAGSRVLLCHSTNHYVRAYVTVNYRVGEANRSVSEMGYILHCFRCYHREIAVGIACQFVGLCPECGGKLSVAGLLWLGKLFDKDFCRKVRDEIEMEKSNEKTRLRKLLDTILEEVDGPPTYYVIDRVCDRYNLPIPPKQKVLSELRAAGYRATHTHFHARGVRTDASAKDFVEIIKRLSQP